MIEKERAFLLKPNVDSESLLRICTDYKKPLFIEQKYIKVTPKFEIRVRATRLPYCRWRCELTLKIKRKTIDGTNTRREINIPIPSRIFDFFDSTHIVKKWRYEVPQSLLPDAFRDRANVTIDVFIDPSNAELSRGRVEMEYTTQSALFTFPSNSLPWWFGREITGEWEYSNYKEAGIPKQNSK